MRSGIRLIPRENASGSNKTYEETPQGQRNKSGRPFLVSNIHPGVFLNIAHQQLSQPLPPFVSAARRRVLRFENFNFKTLNMSADLPVAEDHSSSSCSSLEARSESRGSSVSEGLREEYEDILKYAVVAPKLLGESSALTQPLPPPPPLAPISLNTRCEGNLLGHTPYSMDSASESLCRRFLYVHNT